MTCATCSTATTLRRTSSPPTRSRAGRCSNGPDWMGRRCLWRSTTAAACRSDRRWPRLPRPWACRAARRVATTMSRSSVPARPACPPPCAALRKTREPLLVEPLAFGGQVGRPLGRSITTCTTGGFRWSESCTRRSASSSSYGRRPGSRAPRRYTSLVHNGRRGRRKCATFPAG